MFIIINFLYFSILQDKGLNKFPEIKEFTDSLYESGCRSPHLLGFIIDLIEEILLTGANNELFQKAIDVSSYSRITLTFFFYISSNLFLLYMKVYYV